MDKYKQQTIGNILEMDTYSEEFQLSFYEMLNKFVKEYDDIAQMDIIKKAGILLKAINEI